jgi:hypothetical protein
MKCSGVHKVLNAVPDNLTSLALEHLETKRFLRPTSVYGISSVSAAHRSSLSGENIFCYKEAIFDR